MTKNYVENKTMCAHFIRSSFPNGQGVAIAMQRDVQNVWVRVEHFLGYITVMNVLKWMFDIRCTLDECYELSTFHEL